VLLLFLLYEEVNQADWALCFMLLCRLCSGVAKNKMMATVSFTSRLNGSALGLSVQKILSSRQRSRRRETLRAITPPKTSTLPRYCLQQKKPKNIEYLIKDHHTVKHTDMSEEPKVNEAEDVALEGGTTGGLRRPKKNRPKTCYHCGRPGHISRDCTNEEATGQMRDNITKEKHHYRRCFNCGR